MKKCAFALALAMSGILGTAVAAQQAFPTTRDPLKWPFTQNSIWNMPIGNNAQYVFAGIKAATWFGSDDNILILTPTAPMTNIYSTNCDWCNGTRCGSATNTVIDKAPIPASFAVPDGGGSANYACAILLADGHTLHQNQPFERCGAGGKAVSVYIYDVVDIKTSDGRLGAHGGSHLSSIGGTIRLGELVPGGVICHAMQIGLWSDVNYSKGHVWPAENDDGGQGGTVPEMKYGALCALKPDFAVSSLLTEPGKIIAQAFTDYGAYPVDDTYWDAYYLNCELSPDGSVVDEFRKTWGYAFDEGIDNNFKKDMVKVFTSLYVVANNSQTNVGGGGTPRVPLAPPFAGSTAIDGHSTTSSMVMGEFKVSFRKNAGIAVELPESANYSVQVFHANGTIAGSVSGSGKSALVNVTSQRQAFGVYIVRIKLDNGKSFVSSCNLPPA